MIPLTTVALTDVAEQNVSLTINLDVYDRLVITNQSLNTLDISSGTSYKRFQPNTVDILQLETPSIQIAVAFAGPASNPHQLQLQALTKDEEVTESYPAVLTVGALATNPTPVTVESPGTIGIKIADGNGNLFFAGQQPMAQSLPVVVASDQTFVPVNVSLSGNALGEGQHTMAQSMPVVVASDQSAVPVVNQGQTGYTASVVTPANNTPTQILASNTNRKGVTIYNDATGTAVGYFVYGNTTITAGSGTNMFTHVPIGGYYELPRMPYIYTDKLSVQSFNLSSGGCRVVEWT